MILLFLSFFFAVSVTFCFCRFVAPTWFKNIPIPARTFLVVNIILTISIFGSLFGSFYYSLSQFNKHQVLLTEAQQIAPIHLSEQAKKVLYSFDANRASVRVLALEALQQGTALSVTISMRPKLEKVCQAAQKLFEISPRYQEQVIKAKKGLRDADDKRDKSLGDYIKKVVEINRYRPEDIVFALDSIRNRDLTSRERIVITLLSDQVNSLHNNGQADPVQWFSEFTQRFGDFVD